ncbi:MAG: alpha/beta fold hydrolase [Solirubrobacteraceae bacterium]
MCLRTSRNGSRRRRAGATAPILTLALALAAGALTGRASAAQPSFAPCARTRGFTCATIAVPLDRSAHVPGTIQLHLARRLAGAVPSRTAVIGIAGGPGQPALPYATAIAGWIAPALRSRDLVVFDQRGTGLSDPLHCSAISGAGARAPALRVIRSCAEQLGGARSGFTTAESVADIEAIREALGYEKLVLYGTSYGTKVAEQYAQTYPDHVEALVLDSVVPPEGEEPLDRPSFEAIGPVLSELCSRHACAHISQHPLAELATLARRLRRRPLAGRVNTGSKPAPMLVTEPELFALLLDGDLDPPLRAMLPAAVRSALHGTPQPLLRLAALASGALPAGRRPPGSGHAPEVDEALFLDTICEDTPFPWRRTSSPRTRLLEASLAIQALPPSAFFPFERRTAAAASTVGACASWPYSGPRPPSPGPLPNVPTLILSGAQDLRTPTSNARALAAQIPDAQVLVVPYTGHSVLGSEPGSCAAKAVQAFFSGARVAPCARARDPFPPTPLPPRSLAATTPFGGVVGIPGRTLHAALDTLAELVSDLDAAQLQHGGLRPGSRFGGLRGGYAVVRPRRVSFHALSLVPGVQLSGEQAVRAHRLLPGRIWIGGDAAAHGFIRVGAGSLITGVLGGRRFSIELHVPASTARVRAARLPG